MISLGLVDRQMIPYQVSASLKAVNGTNLTHLPAGRTVCRGRKSSPGLKKNLAHARSAHQHGWTFGSPPYRDSGSRNYGRLPPSPSFTRYNIRMRSRNAQPITEISSPDGFSFDKPIEAKRMRALSSLFKAKSFSKASCKGDKEPRKVVGHSWSVPDSGMLVEDGNRGKESIERERLEKVRCSSIYIPL